MMELRAPYLLTDSQVLTGCHQTLESLHVDSHIGVLPNSLMIENMHLLPSR